MKQRTLSVYSDHKTGFFYKVCIILGALLLIIYLIETSAHIFGLTDGSTASMLGFAILLLGIGIILFFFSFLFSKLASIAEEIEQLDETECIDEPEGIEKTK